MNLSPYLTFDGRCKATFAFYEKALGARLTMLMTFGESPMREHTPQDQHDLVLHASLDLGGGQMLLASDAPPDRCERPRGFMVSYGVETVDDARRVFEALIQGGTVTMPIAPTFWSPQFGMLVDRFGIPWIINCEAAPAA